MVLILTFWLESRRSFRIGRGRTEGRPGARRIYHHPSSALCSLIIEEPARVFHFCFMDIVWHLFGSRAAPCRSFHQGTHHLILCALNIPVAFTTLCFMIQSFHTRTHCYMNYPAIKRITQFSTSIGMRSKIAGPPNYHYCTKLHLLFQICQSIK